MRNGARRRQLILSLVKRQPIHTQDELVEALRHEGLEASQASVSRDISALGLFKVDGRYRAPQRAMRRTSHPLAARLRDHMLSADSAGAHLVVIRTHPGEAGALALAIDNASLPGVVGTVAGDDTIFAAMTDARSCKKLLRRLRDGAGG
ncbi:MAG: arginine repressor [Acidobacteriota bacterium]|nr:MAG: arginine repressor [Acidobacteriota bacterium]